MLSGILFVLTTGIAWQRLPQELGYGSGITCWRRLRDWHRAGVFRRLHELLLAKLRQRDQLDLSRAVCGMSCFFCKQKIAGVDYKNVAQLRRFISDRDKIRGRGNTGTCRKHQQQLAVAIKRAREMALLPYVGVDLPPRGATGAGR